MPQTAMDVLRKYKEWQDAEKEAMGDLWNDKGMVFTRGDGNLMYSYTPSQWFAKFRKRHSLPDVTFHGLRHTNASLLISEGVDIQTLAGRLGHARTTTTTDVYSHFLQRPDRIAAAKLEEKFAGMQTGKENGDDGERK